MRNTALLNLLYARCSVQMLPRCEVMAIQEPTQQGLGYYVPEMQSQDIPLSCLEFQ